MTAALPFACLAGLGLFLIYDGFTRPAARPLDPRRMPLLAATILAGLVGGLAGWLQIGRASCRERV